MKNKIDIKKLLDINISCAFVQSLSKKQRKVRTSKRYNASEILGALATESATENIPRRNS